jgi:hypothetical protein
MPVKFGSLGSSGSLSHPPLQEPLSATDAVDDHQIPSVAVLLALDPVLKYPSANNVA